MTYYLIVPTFRPTDMGLMYWLRIGRLYACRLYNTIPKTGEQSHAVIGRRYEERCQAMLRTIGITTRHVGGRSDGGIDLCGLWQLPTPLPVTVQCKYINRPCPPTYVRELEGTVESGVGVLIAAEGASRAAVERMTVSETPLIFLRFDMVRLRSAFVNKALQRLVPKLVVGSRHVNGNVEPAFFYND